MFCHSRTIYLGDTDAAGVAYFTNLLSICHEAYEASLTAAGVPLADLLNHANTAIPIVHVESRFLHPLHCGDVCAVQLTPHGWQAHRFSVDYRLYRIDDGGEVSGANVITAEVGRPAATATTQHYCIDPATRQRQDLPDGLQVWYQRWSEPEEIGSRPEA